MGGWRVRRWRRRATAAPAGRLQPHPASSALHCSCGASLAPTWQEGEALLGKFGVGVWQLGAAGQGGTSQRHAS